MNAIACGSIADLSGFSVDGRARVACSDPEFQRLAEALHAIADRVDARQTLRAALQAAGWFEEE